METLSQTNQPTQCYCGMYIDIFNNEFEITECVYCTEGNKTDAERRLNTYWNTYLDYKIDEYLNASENEKYLMQFE